MKIKDHIQHEKGVFTLMRNGQPAICPFRNPIVIPGNLAGQIQIMPSICNSTCPHFFNKDIQEGTIEFRLNCGLHPGAVRLDLEDKDHEKSNNIKLY